MRRKVGSIIGYQNIPHIYIIVKQKFIYIGETQSLPVSRWGQHIYQDGTFNSKLKKINIELANSNKHLLYFFGYSCGDLIDIFDSKEIIRRNTQYIEDYIHRKFVSHKFYTKLQLISDTEKTAVLRANSPLVDIISEEIFDLIIEDIQHKILN